MSNRYCRSNYLVDWQVRDVVDSRRNSQLMRKGRKMGRWRAMLDLAEPLQRELGAETSAYSNAELEQAINS